MNTEDTSGVSPQWKSKPKATEPFMCPSPCLLFSGGLPKSVPYHSASEHADQSSEDKVSVLNELGTSLKLLLLLEFASPSRHFF